MSIRIAYHVFALMLAAMVGCAHAPAYHACHSDVWSPLACELEELCTYKGICL